jgi:hypothetical protein
MLYSAEAALASNPARQIDKSSAPKTQQTIRVKPDNLRVQLTQCLRESEKVTCTFLVSSLKDELTVWVSDPNRAKSRVIDAEGNEYSSFEVLQFGKPESGALLVKRTPIRLVVSFSKLPEKISSVALLELGLETYGHEIPVRFRKIEFLNASTPDNTKNKPDQGTETQTTPNELQSPESEPEESPEATEPPATESSQSEPSSEELPTTEQQDVAPPVAKPQGAQEQQKSPGKVPTKTKEPTQPSEARPPVPKQPPTETPEATDQTSPEEETSTPPDELSDEETPEATDQTSPEEETSTPTEQDTAQPPQPLSPVKPSENKAPSR